MIKAVIFDYGGVLSVRGNFREFCEMYAPKFGKPVDEFRKLFLENWFQARVNKIDSGLLWKKVATFLDIDKETLRKDLMDFFGFSYAVLELARKLKSNYKLGLLSNQIEDWLEEVIEEHKLNEIFDAIVTSYNSGVPKPDIGIYRKIVEKLDVKAEECVYVDDMESNLNPAKELGMETILFRDVEQFKRELMDFSVKIE